MHAHTKALEAALEREQAPPAALSLAVPLLAAKVGTCVSEHSNTPAKGMLDQVRVVCRSTTWQICGSWVRWRG